MHHETSRLLLYGDLGEESILRKLADIFARWEPEFSGKRICRMYIALMQNICRNSRSCATMSRAISDICTITASFCRCTLPRKTPEQSCI